MTTNVESILFTFTRIKYSTVNKTWKKNESLRIANLEKVVVKSGTPQKMIMKYATPLTFSKLAYYSKQFKCDIHCILANSVFKFRLWVIIHFFSSSLHIFISRRIYVAWWFSSIQLMKSHLIKFTDWISSTSKHTNTFIKHTL